MIQQPLSFKLSFERSFFTATTGSAACSPDVKRQAWTAEEELELAAAHTDFGSSWTRVSAALTGRPPNACKNRFNCVQVRVYASPKFTDLVVPVSADQFRPFRRSFPRKTAVTPSINPDVTDTLAHCNVDEGL